MVVKAGRQDWSSRLVVKVVVKVVVKIVVKIVVIASPIACVVLFYFLIFFFGRTSERLGRGSVVFGRLSLESIRKNEGDRMLEELAKDRKYLQVIGIFFV